MLPFSTSNSSDNGVAGMDDTARMPNAPSSNPPFAAESQADKLNKIKAKLEEKRKMKAKIEEKKNLLLRARQEKAAANASTLNVGAAVFDPTSIQSVRTSGPTTMHAGPSSIQAPPPSVPLSNLAARNAERFSDKQLDTASQLPSDLRGPDTANTIAANNALRNAGVVVGSGNGREHLLSASSLIGTCVHSCPDEEILRREQEGDVQLLERPDTDTVHPRHWTLRDTMVKRFRRSAADFKLDVPEWVRPPDVLERVCGYLEEWVMVR